MIYALSDVHGDKKQAIRLLKKHKIVDEEGRWKAGDSTLVVGGDSTDRGSDGIGVLRYFLNLSQEAKEAGGRLIHLMGNHDALILCVALHQVANDYDYEHAHVFRGNGGKMHEATSLSKMKDLLRYVQSFPLMCRVDDILFQHADGFETYNTAMKTGTTSDERILAANAYCRDRAKTAWGAWNLFYDLTGDRYWQNSGELMPEYLESLGAKIVVHGHTGFHGNAPMRYLDDMVVNIDAIMSGGYRKDEERGCVLVVDSPGTNIVV